MKREKKQEYALFTAWGASFIATLGSLYFSEIMKFEPCVLCWYQRIFMYPFVLWLGIAVIKKTTTLLHILYQSQVLVPVFRYIIMPFKKFLHSQQQEQLVDVCLVRGIYKLVWICHNPIFGTYRICHDCHL